MAETLAFKPFYYAKRNKILFCTNEINKNKNGIALAQQQFLFDRIVFRMFRMHLSIRCALASFHLFHLSKQLDQKMKQMLQPFV